MKKKNKQKYQFIRERARGDERMALWYEDETKWHCERNAWNFAQEFAEQQNMSSSKQVAINTHYTVVSLNQYSFCLYVYQQDIKLYLHFIQFTLNYIFFFFFFSSSSVVFIWCTELQWAKRVRWPLTVDHSCPIRSLFVFVKYCNPNESEITCRNVDLVKTLQFKIYIERERCSHFYSNVRWTLGAFFVFRVFSSQSCVQIELANIYGQEFSVTNDLFNDSFKSISINQFSHCCAIHSTSFQHFPSSGNAFH